MEVFGPRLLPMIVSSKPIGGFFIPCCNKFWAAVSLDGGAGSLVGGGMLGPPKWNLKCSGMLCIIGVVLHFRFDAIGFRHVH